jgi:hypothetical protein
MRTIALIVLSCILSGGVAWSQDEAATKTIKKAITAHGGEEALKKAKSAQTKMTGQMQLLGMDLDFSGEVVYDIPGKFRLSMDVKILNQKQSIVQIVNGDKLKQTTNGMSVKLGEQEKGEMLQAALMQEVTLLTPLLTDKFTIKADKSVEADGMNYDVVIVTGKNFKETKLFFDSKTGLMAKTERKAFTLSETGPKEVTEVGLMSDYKKFDGIQLPTKMQVLHNGKKFMTMTMTDVKMLEKVDAKQFATDE